MQPQRRMRQRDLGVLLRVLQLRTGPCRSVHLDSSPTTSSHEGVGKAGRSGSSFTSRATVAMSAWAMLCRGAVELRELPFDLMAQLRQKCTPCPPERLQLLFGAANFFAHHLELAFPFGLRLTQQHLGFALGLFPDLGPQLLGTHQRFIDRLVAILKAAQLLAGHAQLRFALLMRARQPLQFFGDLLAELIDARAIIATQRVAEVVAPRIECCEMEATVCHDPLTRSGSTAKQHSPQTHVRRPFLNRDLVIIRHPHAEPAGFVAGRHQRGARLPRPTEDLPQHRLRSIEGRHGHDAADAKASHGGQLIGQRRHVAWLDAVFGRLPADVDLQEDIQRRLA
jgi:hypothetical protein